MKKLNLTLLMTPLYLIAAWVPCHAAGVVTDCSKFGTTIEEGTLAWALDGGGDVDFACNGTIIVEPEIRIETDTVIDSNGFDVVLSGNNKNSVFWVREEKNLDLLGLKITKGAAYGAVRNLGGSVNIDNCVISESTAMYGGGIRNENWMNTYIGTMTLTNTIVSNNTAYSSISNSIGGGIYNFGIMTLTACIVKENSARTDTGSASGGGIVNGSENSALPGTGSLTLINCTVFDNTALNYGGIWNMGKLTLQSSSVVGNSATNGNAGGIFNNQNGKVTIINSKISGNTSFGGVYLSHGGGIYSYGGTISIENSAVSNNHSDDVGGGISTSVDATLEVSNSTISGNSCNDRGGGISSFGGQATITNSTLSGNNSFQGGGIYNYAPLTLNYVTFSGNSAKEGSNLYVVNNTRAVTEMSNSLITNGLTSSNCFCPGDWSLYLTDGGYNLADDDSCYLTDPSSMPLTDPLLDPILKNNGGLTETHALMAGSDAIDAIPYGVNGCGDTITTDQRGIIRPQGDGCEIGAYEIEYYDTDNDGVADYNDNCPCVFNPDQNIHPCTDRYYTNDYDKDCDVDGDDLYSFTNIGANDLASFSTEYGFIGSP